MVCVANREIGGYLELERFLGVPYHEHAFAFNCGRSCLEFLIRLRGIQVIWLPDFMCNAVPNVCRKLGTEVRFYQVGEDFRPIYDFGIGDSEYLYVCDYYGQLAKSDVRAALEQAPQHVIVDEAQGFFCKPWAGVDTLYTCRKFFGVTDGGYLYTREMFVDVCHVDSDQHLLPAAECPSEVRSLFASLLQDESHGRMDFVLGRFERPASEFFRESQVNNDSFANGSCKRMSALTENLLRAVDYEAARLQREANWDVLEALLGEMNLLAPRKPLEPYMYPLLVDSAEVDALALRRRLAQEGIYIPILWPNVLNDCDEDSVAFRYSRDILPLPLDQRYGTEDMRYLANLLCDCTSERTGF